MVVTIKSGDEEKKIQLALNALQEDINREKKIKKERILKKTFGKVKFHPTKTPLEIQKELRDEWE
jgi:hypothetical protein